MILFRLFVLQYQPVPTFPERHAGTAARQFVSSKTMGYIFATFFGWVIGWTSATIARLLYPPPKKRPAAGPKGYPDN
jgi:hypothetical protein